MPVFAKNLAGHTQLLHGFCGVPSSSPNAFATEKEAASYTQNNRCAALDALHMPHPSILLKQTHSTDVQEVTDHFLQTYDPTAPPEGDVLISQKPNVPIGVRTADCGPLLWFETEKKIIAATHAGWRGALNGAIEATLDAFEHLGGHKDNLVVALGPTIHPTQYEVGEDFQKTFLEKNESFTTFFVKESQKVYFDLPSFLMHKLNNLGLKQCLWTGHNTFEPLFFSRRRALHSQKHHGSNYAFIMKRDVT